MTHTQLLLAVILLQQGLFAVLWLIAARLRLSRRPALHWALASTMVAAGMSLMLLRGQGSPWLTVAVANLLLIAAFVIIRRGLQVFARRRPMDLEHGLVLAVGGCGVVLGTLRGTDLLPVVVCSSAVVGWTMLRGAFELRRALAEEIGGAAATWCALPLILVGGVFALRAVAAPLLGAPWSGPIDMPTPANTGIAFASLALGLLLTATLIALVTLRLVRRMQFQSDHDLVTGLLSRRAMERRLLVENQRRRRLGGGYALLSVDIDHFKRINDRFGHAAGDAVLARVAASLQHASREVDSVARMGGEEFCLLLPGTDQAGAERAAQRLLAAVRALRHPETEAALQVTVSVGVVAVDEAPASLAAVHRRLDRALYAAKEAGRDRAALAEPAPAD